MIESPVIPKPSWFLRVTVVAFVAVFIFSAYYQIQVSRIQSQINDLQAKKTELSTPLSSAQTNANDAIAQAVAIKAQLQKMDTTQLKWSKLIAKIESSIPKSQDTKEPLVSFLSYSGTSDGVISVSAQTRQSAADPYADTATVVKAFSNDSAFKNVFVPSVTKSSAPDGTMILNFGLTFTYNQQNF